MSVAAGSFDALHIQFEESRTDVPGDGMACDDGNATSRDGCTATCDAGFGWECDATGACDASEAAPTATFGAMSSTELNEFCTWMVGMLGGPGRRYTCGALVYTVNTVAQCEENIPMITTISERSVADFEGWTAERVDACDFFASTAPAC